MKRILALCLAAALVLPACVKVDGSLGQGLIDKSLLYDTYTVEFKLEQIRMRCADSLSGYSDTRLCIGAIRDPKFGLSTREAAFSLIPALDTIDFGSNPQAVSFNLRFAFDTVSCAADADARIMQNLYVTSLLAPLPETDTRISGNEKVVHGSQIVTDGLPVYNGKGDLIFSFTKSFAQHYLDEIRALGPVLKDRQNENGTDRYKELLEKLPGVHIRTSLPEGDGGRFNLFKFSCLSVSDNYYYRNNNVGMLKVHSIWNGIEKDSTFLMIPGEPSLVDETAALTNNTKFSQYCFNQAEHATVDRPATDELLVEGGGGLKPVIPALELQQKTLDAIRAHGGSAETALIVKASLILPFAMPANYEDFKYYPSMLSPTICMYTQGKDSDSKPYFYHAYAGLTDASVSTENQGEIDRSNLRYAPDFSYHLQQLLSRTDLDTKPDADIWLLAIHSEQVANATGSAYDSEYYQNLLYASYYNSLYGGGYGYGGYGYGGYGYGSSYSNYYTYMMLAQMMASSSEQSYTTTSELDKDRFYRAILNGTTSADPPRVSVTFALPKR